jgi:hypothetical protein
VFRELGLDDPPSDPAAAWNGARKAAANAINAIREEVQVEP